jgi:hypothetical protein
MRPAVVRRRARMAIRHAAVRSAAGATKKETAATRNAAR